MTRTLMTGISLHKHQQLGLGVRTSTKTHNEKRDTHLEAQISGVNVLRETSVIQVSNTIF